MNDMTRPDNAARLSEDIGDVLSSIRRMIAEDEAKSAIRRAPQVATSIPSNAPSAREILDQDEPFGGDYLARRFGGNAALARSLALDSLSSARTRSASDRPWSAPSAALAPPVAAAQTPDILPEPAPAAPFTFNAPAFVPLTATRSVPARKSPAIAPAPVATAGKAPILRLGPSDRVISRANPEDAPVDDDLLAPIQWRPHRDPMPLATTAPELAFEDILDAEAEAMELADPELAIDDWADVADEIFDDMPEADLVIAVSQPIPDVEAPLSTDDEDDDFAEQFDAKARMRPHLILAEVVAEQQEPALAPVAQDLTPPPIAEPRLSFAERLAQVIRGASAAPEASSKSRASDQPVFTDIMIAPAAEVILTPADTPVAEEVIAVSSPPNAQPSAIDDESMRALIRDMIAEELHGELGNRFARNLRAVIRREVASAIDDQMDRF